MRANNITFLADRRKKASQSIGGGGGEGGGGPTEDAFDVKRVQIFTLLSVYK